ncbi:MAG: 30S ribosomal protein S16 [Candidatus Aminicenantes bacterium RBG_13_62_12]|nr:MAG: 30S ribosomal protein S16 [Candidatus Aminicenantes bacterium RBG_13_62_12]
MLAMRLMRSGAKSKPAFRIVVLDSRKPRESKARDYIGYYNPLTEPAEIKLDLDKAKMWLAKGAQASRTVQSLLHKAEKRIKASK